MLGALLRRSGILPPKLDAMEDMTGRSVGMDYLIDGLGNNYDWPAVGDVVAKLTTCSMGVSIRRDTRWRVTELQDPYDTSFRVVNAEGVTGIFHIHSLRRHSSIRRFWILRD